jgi:gas vesicle protein
MTTRQENTTGPRPQPAKGHSSGLLRGLFGGALIGTTAGVLFAPEIYAALRQFRRQLADAGDAAADRYRDATARVGDAVGDFQQKAREVNDRTLSVVARGADDVAKRVTEGQIESDQSALNAPRQSP